MPRSLFANYVAYIHGLAYALRTIPTITSVRYALVDSDPQLASKPANRRAALCYDWDRRMVEEADLVIADASFPSTGLGIELQIAQSKGIPIIMLIGDLGVNRVDRVHYENPDRKRYDLQIGEGIVSLMALGLPAVCEAISYKEFNEAIAGAITAVTRPDSRLKLNNGSLG